MKKNLLLLFALLIYININAQFDKHNIITGPNRYLSVYAADIDGDGDMDVLSNSFDGGALDWHENTDGKGTFIRKRVTTSYNYGQSVYAEDMDGDGDMDVLFAGNNKVSWYENTDGKGTFGSEQVLNAKGAVSIYAADVDGDGDMDIISSSNESTYSHNLIWYKNTDGKGSFTEQIITTDAYSVRSIFAADMDDDGDMDVVSTFPHANSPKTVWFKNLDGKGTFENYATVIIDDGNRQLHAHAADLDDDSKMDVLATSKPYYSGEAKDYKISWYKYMTVESETLWVEQQVIATVEDVSQEEFKMVYTFDMDGDGDMDVLATNFNKIVWYENTDGKGSFGEKINISTTVEGDGYYSVYATDINGNGDIDVLSASYSGVDWYGEYLLSTDVFEQTTFKIYPNPVKDQLFIEANNLILEEVTVFDYTGRMVRNIIWKANNLNFTDLASGMYILKIKTDQGSTTHKLVKQ